MSPVVYIAATLIGAGVGSVIVLAFLSWLDRRDGQDAA